MSQTSDPETGFLEQLGQRVRTMRALRGMSRKVLAKVSGISERYIAQLEAGRGNVSIVLLRRVSHAMGAHLEDLIPAGEPAPDWPVIRDLLRKATPNQIAQARDVLSAQSGAAQRRMSFSGIALIGLRGAGKSTLGKLLAKKIGWSFVELNKEIEAQNGLSVAEIIALYGQEGFRRLEQAALTQLLARNELTVLATGGGIVSEPVTFDLILSSFYTIWLKAEPEEHMARVRKQGDLRPMADDRSAMAELRNILTSREPLYARASAVVDTAGLQVDAAATRLLDAVRPVLQSEARSFGLRSVALARRPIGPPSARPALTENFQSRRKAGLEQAGLVPLAIELVLVVLGAEISRHRELRLALEHLRRVRGGCDGITHVRESSSQEGMVRVVRSREP